MILSKLFLVLLMVVLIFNCFNDEGNETIQITILKEYGDDEENILSFISDFDYHNNKVYILDSPQQKFFIFNIDGTLLHTIQLKSGKGPGEFSSGPEAFKVINDSILAVLDRFAEKIELITIENKYLNTINIEFLPHKLFCRDSLIYISGNSKEKLIWVYNLDGQLVDTLITPFETNDIPVYWVSEVAMDKENAFYITNPYKTEIIKWHNEILWKFSDEKSKLVKPPESKVRGKSISMYQTRGWTTNGIFNFGNYLIASTFSNDVIKSKKLLPHILVLDKNTGELLFMEEREQLFRAKSYHNGRLVFMAVNEPFPQLKKIELKIIRE